MIRRSEEPPLDRGEHKQITFMFVDVVRSMALAEALEPERWHRLLDRFYGVASAAVERVGGTVQQFTGDGIMALFGAPVAYEDHARRGCLAALEVHRGIPALAAALEGSELLFAVRIGLASGEAIAGGVGERPRPGYSAFGHVVGLAQQMQGLARPGSTALSASTARLVQDDFALSDLGEVKEQGSSVPRRIVELVGPSAASGRLSSALARGALSNFVGRERELDALEAGLAVALGGDGQVIALVGEAGVGKSRLAHEFLERARAHEIDTFVASAPSHGREVALLLMIEMMRNFLRISADAGAEETRAQITAQLKRLGPEVEVERPLLFDLLGLSEADESPPIDPDARQRRLLALISKLVRARSEQAPAVLLVEDLHWMDTASAVFLDELVQAVAGARVLLIATYRPEYAGGVLRGAHCEQLAIRPLRGEAVGALLGGLLGRDPSLDGLSKLIAARSGGNPFFCEELAHALADEGRLVGPRGERRLVDEDVEIILPATVQATLAARIDRLGERDKDLLLIASVIGPSVDARLLALVSAADQAKLTDTLRALIRSNLMVERSGEGPTEYAFRHPLIQEVAYRGQLRDRRKWTHARVADALIKLHSDRLEERSALIAHHVEGADRTAEAAQWHARAAGWAGTTSPQEAMRHWQTAKRLADGLPAGAERNGLAIGARLGVLGQAWRLQIAQDVADDAHRETVELLDPSQEDGVLRVLLEYAYCANLSLGGRIAQGLEVARANSRRAEALNDPNLIVLTAGAHWYGALNSGHAREGYDVSSNALQRAAGDTRTGAILSGAVDHPYALCLYGVGYCAGFLGQVRQGMVDIRLAIELARDEGVGEVEPYALCGLTFLHAMIGESDAAMADASAALAAAEHRGNSMALVAAWLALVWAGLAVDDHVLTSRAAHEMLAITSSRGVGVELVTFAHGALADVHLAAGHVDLAVACAQHAVRSSLHPEPTWGELMGRLRLAQALVARDGKQALPDAQSEVERAAAIASRHAITICDPRIHAGRAAIARLRGENEQADAHELAEKRALLTLSASGSGVTATQAE